MRKRAIILGFSLALLVPAVLCTGEPGPAYGEEGSNAPAKESKTGEVQKVSNTREVDPATGLPTLSTRRANTTVRVKDGDTIVIGGLTLEQESTRVRKVPLLSEIPVLGELFKRRTSSSVSTELVIYLTPHIITGSEVSPFAGQPEETGKQGIEAPPQ